QWVGGIFVRAGNRLSLPPAFAAHIDRFALFVVVLARPQLRCVGHPQTCLVSGDADNNGGEVEYFDQLLRDHSTGRLLIASPRQKGLGVAQRSQERTALSGSMAAGHREIFYSW